LNSEVQQRVAGFSLVKQHHGAGRGTSLY